MPTEVQEKPKKVTTPKWNMNQDDYIELLRSVDTNAKAINKLIEDVKTLKNIMTRVQTRMGL